MKAPAIVLAIVVIIQSAMIVGVIEDGKKKDDTTSFKACMDGWRKTIDDWNISTKELNERLGVK